MFYQQKLNNPRGLGDGTVPIASASALDVPVAQNAGFDKAVISKKEQMHEAVYGRKKV